jgi:FkbM family methyltransferase
MIIVKLLLFASVSLALQLVDEFSRCVVNVANHLPIAHDGTISVHHWDSVKTRNHWNDHVRWQDLSLTSESVVIDVGGHRTGLDSQVFHDRFKCRIHVYEPVPTYCAELATVMSSRSTVTVHCAGIGNENRTFFISESDLHEQSTFLATDHGGHGQIPIKIIDAADAFGSYTRDSNAIDVLNVNCEGCEWELFPRLIALPAVMRQIRRLQFSFHNYGPSGQFGERFALYCHIRVGLLKTHIPVRVMPWGWEVWSLRS